MSGGGAGNKGVGPSYGGSVPRVGRVRFVSDYEVIFLDFVFVLAQGHPTRTC